MSGIVGIVSRKSCKDDLLYATDYHSHLGTEYGGIALSIGKRVSKRIHNISTHQFKSRFVEDAIYKYMRGNKGLGVISDRDAQPLICNLKFGQYAIAGAGYISNQNKLARRLVSEGCLFTEMNNGVVNQMELVAHLINKGKTLENGLELMQEEIKGSMSVLLLGKEGIIATRDKYGRTPLSLAKKMGIDKKVESRAVAFETFSYQNQGFRTERFLGPGEIVLINEKGVEQIKKPGKLSQICMFLFVYTGFPASEYGGEFENLGSLGKNVEAYREAMGKLMAKNDDVDIDFSCGVADSGTGYAPGYAHAKGVPFKRPLLKYTPGWARSYMPQKQKVRDFIAKMKQLVAREIIINQSFVVTEDSIVRGTQLKNFTVVKLRGRMFEELWGAAARDAFWDAGAKEIHIRPACPPLMWPCNFLLTTRKKTELFARKVIRDINGKELKDSEIQPYLDSTSTQYKKMIKVMQGGNLGLNVTTLKYPKLEDTIVPIGINKENLCTYCWDGCESPCSK